MDERLRELIGRLQERLAEASEAQVMTIISEAREEGLAEAKELLKALTVQMVLERAIAELDGPGARRTTRGALTSPPTAKPAPSGARQRRTRRAPAAPASAEASKPPTTAEEAGVPLPEEDHGHGYYVYAVIGDDGEEPPRTLPEEGIDPGYRVYALHHEGLQAIVSKVSLDEFGQEKLTANLNDIQWLAGKVQAHHEVVEAVLDGCTPIPMRLCTIYRTEERVRQMLSEHHDELIAELQRLQGTKEWGVKLFCDRLTLSQHVAESEAGIRQLRSQAEGRSSGQAYFAKKALEGAMAREMDRLSDECARDSHDRISGHAEDAVLCPMQSRAVTGREDEMVQNGAYLVREQRRAALQTEVQALQEQYGRLGFSFEVTGPWAPHNFVSPALREAAGHE